MECFNHLNDKKSKKMKFHQWLMIKDSSNKINSKREDVQTSFENVTAINQKLNN